MPRKRKKRCVSCIPADCEFKPANLSTVEEIRLQRDELEALKLRDYDGIKQSDAAKIMKISQPTFYRILTSVRKKLADAILNGKIIKIGEFNEHKDE